VSSSHRADPVPAVGAVLVIFGLDRVPAARVADIWMIGFPEAWAWMASGRAARHQPLRRARQGAP
jgi:hypothetical protein